MAHRSYSKASVLTVVHGVLVEAGVVTASELLATMREKAAGARVRGNWAELVESLSVAEVFTALKALVKEKGSKVHYGGGAGAASFYAA